MRATDTPRTRKRLLSEPMVVVDIGVDSSLEIGQPFSPKIRDGAALFAATAVVRTGASDIMPHINQIF